MPGSDNKNIGFDFKKRNEKKIANKRKDMNREKKLGSLYSGGKNKFIIIFLFRI